MKKLLVFLGFVNFVNCFSQGSIVTVFSEKGDKFWLILNGQKINQSPETRVTAEKLAEVSYRVKIIFENPKISDIESTIYTKDADGNFSKATYAIKEKKGKYKLSLVSYEPISAVQNITPQVNQPVTQPQQVNQQQIQQTNISGIPQTNVTITETQEGINFNIQTPGLNIQTHGVNVQHQTGTNTSTLPPTPTGQVVMQPIQAQSTSIKCKSPMPDSDFQEALKSISSKSFEDSKLTLAKQITSSNCLKCAQIKSIMKLFSFESSRLEYAKFAYKYAFDKSNYFMLNDVFQFESSIEELNEYINSNNW